MIWLPAAAVGCVKTRYRHSARHSVHPDRALQCQTVHALTAAAVSAVPAGATLVSWSCAADTYIAG